MMLKCSLITPIFIGCGEEYTPLDYYIENNIAHIVDIEKALEVLGNLKSIDEISDYIVKKSIGNRVETNAKDILERVGLCAEDYVVYKIKSEIKEDSRTRVKKFIHQNNRKYIPGSSIKGAIRTAYLFNYYDGKISEIFKILDNKKIDNKGKEIERRAIGDIRDDFFKYLKISDSIKLEREEFKFILTKRWHIKKKKLTIPNYLEGMTKGEFIINLKVEEEFFKELNNRLNKNFNPKNDYEKFEIIKELCNNFSKTVVDFEIKRDLPIILKEFYEKLKKDIEKNDAIYINLGFEGGFLNKTIYPLLWKNDQNNILFHKIRQFFLDLYKPKGKINPRNPQYKLYQTWQNAKSYLDFPTTVGVYVKHNRISSPLGWIKLEKVN
ncbi:type III-A CRISPR-associated RAMP protein Csm5 [Methanocaldococcus villosus]|nr:type III-A CRISPR-associated RAMP protein Csm5 [Methanocaldococcus villosus]